jgi:hypothetical protein
MPESGYKFLFGLASQPLITLLFNHVNASYSLSIFTFLSTSLYDNLKLYKYYEHSGCEEYDHLYPNEDQG